MPRGKQPLTPIKLSYEYDPRDRVVKVSRSGGLGAIGSKLYTYERTLSIP